MGEQHIAQNPQESILKTFLASLASYATQFQLGAMLGQSSTMIPQLQSPDSSIKIDDEYASWIASMGVVGTPFSAVLCGPLTDKLGRRNMLRLFFMLAAIGNALVGVSSDVTEILIGRFLLGVSAGFGFPSLVYVSEICSPQHRNLLLPFATISSSLGLVYVYTAGAYLNWDIVSLQSAGLAVLFLIYAFIIPESPVWLFKNHRLTEAIDGLKWLRGNNCDIDKELKKLKDACTKLPMETASVLSQLNSASVIKPFFILLCLTFLQNGTGFYILLYYSVSFLSEFKASFDPAIVSVGIAVTRLISCSIAAFVMKVCGRKTLGALSGITMGLLLLVIFIYLTLFGNDASLLAQYSFLPTVCMLLYVFACGFGVHPLPWLMIYELYPLNIRGFMCGVSNAVNYIFTFMFLKLYYIFLSNLRLSGTIVLFLSFSFAFGLFCLIILPETRGKTLEEIEEGFERKNKVVRSEEKGGKGHEEVVEEKAEEKIEGKADRIV